jgi:hypothetical protein
MRTLLLTAALTASAPAFAGGIGIMGHGGIHSERVFYYSTIDPSSNTQITNPDNYLPLRQVQLVPQFGGGLEFILGDRDDNITGVFRGYWNLDLAQGNPADRTTAVNAENVVSAHRDEALHLGMASVGLNWMAVGDRDGLRFGASVHVGAAVLSPTQEEFLIVSAGPSINYRLSRPLIGFADLQYHARYRKVLSNGVQGVVGLRYMFD